MTETTTRTLGRKRRQDLIGELVLASGSVDVNELAERFAVSLMTVHRDLDELERIGLLRKVRGGATAQPSNLFESNIRYRNSASADEKHAIARRALDEVEDGQAVMLDDSTTTLRLAQELAERRTSLTVITNSNAALGELAGVRGIDLILLGGRYSPTYDAFLGVLAVQALQTLRAEVLFMSISAIGDGELFHQSEENVTLKRCLMAATARKILLVDHSKFAKNALHHVCHVSDFDLVIVDDGIGRADLEVLAEAGVEVAVAPR